MSRRSQVVCTATLFLAAAGTRAVAQVNGGAFPSESRRIVITRVTEPPTIDGRLDDPAWQAIAPIAGFWKMRPVDDEPASERTEAYFAYDGKALYVAIHAYEAHPGGVRASLAARDRIFDDDFVGVFLDTYRDRRRGYELFVNPLGVQADCVVSQGADDDCSIDLVWRSAGRRTDDGFTVELAVPFRSLRFKSAATQDWGFAVIREVQHSSNQEIFPRVDVDNNCLLCQEADLVGLQGIKPGRTFELLPTLTGRQHGARPDAASPFANGPTVLDAGVGLKYGITPNLTADLTLNPDFSQVESDAGQVEVNQRFALFFSEKRPFFLEGQDIFQTPIQLVYTRTIFQPLAATKVTGKLGGTTLGVLSAVDEAPLLPRGDQVAPGDSFPDARAAFNVVRLKQDLGTSNTVGFLATDREFAGSHNRVAGADARVQFGGLYSVSVQGVVSDTRNLDGGRRAGGAAGVSLSRSAPAFNFQLTYNDVAPGFRADAGFVRRTDLREGAVWLGYQLRPNGRVLLRWTPQLAYRRLYDYRGVLQEAVLQPHLSLQLARQTFVSLGTAHVFERFADSAFHKNRVSADASSAPSKLWSGGAYVEQGPQINYDPDSAYLGYSRDLGVFSTLRPSDAVSVDLNFVKSTFWRARGGPRVFDVNIWRVKTAYQFSRELFLRLIGEWNTYDRAFGLNALLSYTASPGTVFFLGTDNGLEGPSAARLRPASRSVFFKASYLWRL